MQGDLRGHTLLSHMTPFDQPPAWVSDAVFYQIFPDRFAASDRWTKPSGLEPWDSPPTTYGYKGGDLAGVIERLDYLTELGVNALYFNPIFASAANHRYHAWDYRRIDPLLGDRELFDELVAACHDRNIRVVIDGVFNHCGRGLFQFHDLLESGEASPWRDWFNVHSWPIDAYSDNAPNYDAWWGLPALPKFDTENPEVREFLMQVGEYWAHRGIDGWRLDVPLEIRTEGFWEEFRQRVRAVNPDLYILAEIWDDASEWINAGDRFDATMNYLFAGHTLAFVAGDRIPGELADGLSYPLKPALNATQYGAAVNHLLEMYPWSRTLVNFNLLDSHDVPRVLDLCGGDPTSVVLATLLQMTFPGAPSVYYGSEIGLPGGKDPANRAGFPWDRATWNHEIYDAHRQLIALRHAEPALRHGEMETLPTDPGSMLYLFTRRHDRDTIVVAVNGGTDAVSAMTQLSLGTSFKTLWGDGGIAGDDRSLRVALPPRSGAVWKVNDLS